MRPSKQLQEHATAGRLLSVTTFQRPLIAEENSSEDGQDDTRIRNSRLGWLTIGDTGGEHYTSPPVFVEGDYFFSLVIGSLLMGSVFSFFISVPMAVVLPIPSFSAVWLSNCPVAFKPLAS
jgi:hypothetical protein